MIEAARETPGEVAGGMAITPAAPGRATAGPEIARRDAFASEAWRAMLALTLGGAAPARMHTVCQATDLTPAALKVLLVLSDGPRPMRELVEMFRHDPSYLTSVVDLLERRGVARREPHPTDRRAKTVALTDEGREVLAQAQKLLAVPPPSMRVLSPAEQRQLLGLLMRVLDVEPGIPEAMRPRIPADMPDSD
jgi:DNA-binding MarR family transcriptional regulator